jgi:hypothetical protein
MLPNEFLKENKMKLNFKYMFVMAMCLIAGNSFASWQAIITNNADQNLTGLSINNNGCFSKSSPNIEPGAKLTPTINACATLANESYLPRGIYFNNGKGILMSVTIGSGQNASVVSYVSSTDSNSLTGSHPFSVSGTIKTGYKIEPQ